MTNESHAAWHALARPRKLVLHLLYPGYFAAAGFLFDASRPVALGLGGGGPQISLNTWLIYVLANLAAGLIAALIASARNPLFMLPAIGGPFSLVGFVNLAFADGGIITVVWHGALGFFASLCLFFRILLFPIERPARQVVDLHELSESEVATVKSLLADLWSIIGLVAKFFIATGAITGVCMTILFRPGYQELAPKVNAIQIVIGFGMATGGLYFWSLAPALRTLLSLRSVVSSHQRRTLIHEM